ncbi:ATP-binding protein, partial [Streptomyces sp. SID12501]|uniref:ATP-binding protein n=1 Tax=Streptomyces sp. SID12501 TaxID=2706042 RepID=UPI0023B320C2
MFGLPATPASVGAARRKVRELLDAWLVDPDTSDNALLVTSELVTNALTHTASERIVCRLHLSAGRLRIEVEDENRGGTLPAQRRPGPDEQCGRGLLLVGVLSSDWGVRDAPHGSGRVVWSELLTEQAELADAAPPATPVTASTQVAASASVAVSAPAEVMAPVGALAPAELTPTAGNVPAAELAPDAPAPVGPAPALPPTPAAALAPLIPPAPAAALSPVLAPSVPPAPA